MKSVTEKGLEILLRQGCGGQERGGVRGGEFFPSPTPQALFTDLCRKQRQEKKKKMAAKLILI